MNTKYNKFWVALLGALVAAGPLAADGKITLAEAISIVIGILTALGVRQVANTP